MQIQAELIFNHELYHKVVEQGITQAERFIWIATANVKDMQVAMSRKRYVSLLSILDELAKQKVSIRLLHAELPSKPFRSSLEKFPRLYQHALEFQHCPRAHWKMVLVDGSFAYTGSANLTGAGIGARSAQKRNFECGLVSKDPKVVRPLMEQFDSLWMGTHCPDCLLQSICPAPIGIDPD